MYVCIHVCIYVRMYVDGSLLIHKYRVCGTGLGDERDVLFIRGCHIDTEYVIRKTFQRSTLHVCTYIICKNMQNRKSLFYKVVSRNVFLSIFETLHRVVCTYIYILTTTLLYVYWVRSHDPLAPISVGRDDTTTYTDHAARVIVKSFHLKIF
jgi:hypothetical protein